MEEGMNQNKKIKWRQGAKRAVALLLSAALLPLLGARGQAKTMESASVENVFFYATNSQGQQVLLRVMPLTQLSDMQHGQLSQITSGADTGTNYYVSYTDNFPATGYGEGKGFTVMELVDYIKRTSPVEGVENITFQGEDVICFMATDGGGNYARSYSYTQMYGEKRYYFEGLYDSQIGWSADWEMPTSDLDVYQQVYADQDPYYADKRAVFQTGVETCAILAYESYDGRTSGTLVNSYSGDIASYVSANKGVTGSLASILDTKVALRVFFPQTEAQLMCGTRTASENFKWIYNLRLDMQQAPALVCQGEVAAPEASFQLSEDGDTLYITLQCETPGASIYYSYDGAPQMLYTGTIAYDVSGIDLETAPIYISMTAVKEGWSDAGVVSARYYTAAPDFPVYEHTLLGDDVVFYPGTDTSDQAWAAWAAALSAVELSRPGESGYTQLDPGSYTVEQDGLTLRLDGANFETVGDYRLIFHADGYASKQTTRRVRYATPELSCAQVCADGQDITLRLSGESESWDYMAAATVALTRAAESRYTTIPSEYVSFFPDGRLVISGAYFSDGQSAFTGPGLYTIRLRSSATTQEFMYANFALDYIDLSPDAWYRQAVDYGIENGLLRGVSAVRFGPETQLTWSMLCAVLYRAAGAPAVEESAAALFPDVAEDAWYAHAVVWAWESGLLPVQPGERLGPEEAVTREQLCSVLYRRAGSPETDLTVLGGWSDGSDGSDPSALAWAVESGAIHGTSAATLSPGLTVTRAQMAQILYNLRIRP
jgi:hypothetical protein